MREQDIKKISNDYSKDSYMCNAEMNLLTDAKMVNIQGQ